MTAHTASLINALVLIVVSAWGYFAPDKSSLTALIPAAFGLAILLCNPGVKAENKIIAHIAVLLTVVVLIALVMPLRGALERESIAGVLRVGLMMAFCVFAVVYFIKSFRDARRNRV
ncbi:MAG: hypothetical protein AAF401_17450 [Pseudomonadota bacterium]